MRIRWPLCCNRLSVSDIRNCPQRFSESLALSPRAPQNVPSPLLSAWDQDSGALQYRVREAPVPATRNHGTNYPESTGIKEGLGTHLKRDELQSGLVQLSAEELRTSL